MKEKARNKYRNLSEKGKEAKRQYSRDRYKKIKEKMSYYWFIREKLLKNAWNKYHNKGGKQKVAEYYKKNADVIKFEAKSKWKKMPEK